MANIKLVYINPTGGYVQSSSTADVAQGLGKIELTGVGGVALDAGAAKLSNLGAPSAGTDAATKAYVDTIASGLSWTAPVVVVATSSITLSGSQSIDGVTPGDGARVLVTGQSGTSPATANGIYIVDTGGAWSRSSDTLQDGTAMFVKQGTTYADTQWVLTTSDPITPGSTAIIFEQFGASSSYNAGNGLALVGNTFSVDLATNSGLEFATGKLQIDVADTNELSLDGNGLNVEGVPSQFKINGSAVSTNVTATNLNALTDSSSFTALHLHANIGFSAIYSNGTFSAGQVGYYRADVNGMDLARADNVNTANGIAVANGAVGAGTMSGKFITQGAYNGFSGLTAGTAYYLSDTTAGNLMTYASLTSGSRAIRIGYAIATDALVVNIQDMGVKP